LNIIQGEIIKSYVLENKYGVLARKICKGRSNAEVEEEARRFGEGRAKAEVTSAE
jgi:hypothetical protein